MAYEKQTWVTGEIITEEKLNHMEDGIAVGGALIVDVTEEDSGDGIIYSLNQTARKIISAMPMVYVHNTTESTGSIFHMYSHIGSITSIGYVIGSDDQGDFYSFAIAGGKAEFIARTLDDYPSYLGEKKKKSEVIINGL